MEFSTLAGSLSATLGAHLPAIFGALALFALGWFFAVAARAATRRIVAMLRINTRIRESTGEEVDAESPLAIGVFWLVLLVALVASLNALNLEAISAPFAQLLAQILGYAPRLIAGTVVLLVAWISATLLRGLASRALSATSLDEKLASEAGMEASVSRSLSDVLFWVVMLLFIPAVLAAFELRGLLEPVQNMLTKFLDLLPNVFAAAVIAFVGWLVARVLRALVTNLLAAAGADRAGPSLGLSDSVRISRLAGTIVFIFVFLPSLIAALDALKIEAVSGPATDMLRQFLAAVPNLFAAAVILVLTWYVAKFATGLLSHLLQGMGFDTLPEKLGVKPATEGQLKPSQMVGAIALFFAMLFATVEAASRLEFMQVSGIVSMFIKFGGDVLLGGAILVIGFWLASLAQGAVLRASGERSPGVARILRFAILGLVMAMGLRAMGIADDIVNLAFGLVLGSVAIAVALSFGLGGREAAGKQMEHWLSSWRDGK